MLLHTCILYLVQRQALRSVSAVRFKHSSSVLYVTGDKANHTVSVLTPYVDMKNQFQDIPTLQRNISLRDLKLNITQLSEQWQILETLISDKLYLENKRNEVAEKMKELRKTGNTVEMEKYRTQGKVLRNELKMLMKSLWSLEEIVILKALALPNDLNPDTPEELEKVVFEHGEVNHFGNTCINHIENGKKACVLEYFSPSHYYLKSTAALYEFHILNYFASELQNCNFVLFSNADFARSIIMEGVGVNYHNPKLVFSLKEDIDTLHLHNREHLVGGASLFSFCAYHAKHVIQSGFIPFRYLSVGNQYTPSLHRSHEVGLFNVSQSSVVEIFIGVQDCYDNMMVEFHQILDLLTKFYSQLGYHFRIVYLPALQLKPWESLHASIQLFSPYLKSYIEVGHLSTCDTYISKRLLLYYETSDSHEHNFVRIISGTVVSVPRLLGCVLESKPFVDEEILKFPNLVANNASPAS